MRHLNRQEARPHHGRRRPQSPPRAAGRANQDRRNGAGYAYLHTALDDHSRLAYTEDLPDEKSATCAGFLQRATAWFAARGVTVERVLTDNAWAYTSDVERQAAFPDWLDWCNYHRPHRNQRPNTSQRVTNLSGQSGQHS